MKTKIFKSKMLLTAVLLFSLSACQKGAVAPVSTPGTAVKANFSSSDKFASYQDGAYTVYNNVWGANAGFQSIWANSHSNWGVWSDQTGGGIKSYPNSSITVSKTLSSLSSVSSSYNSTAPADGAWESTYDIWDSGHNNETMLWMNYTGNSDGSGNVKPISSKYSAQGNAIAAYTNVTVGGHTWNVFHGMNGSISVVSFLATTKTNSGTVDVLAIQRWIESKGIFGNITQGDVQYGFEITTTNGGENFTVNSYSTTWH